MTSETQNHIESSEPDLSSQIYKATYSGVPVWEFRVRNVAVMRRKTDSWLNATQILKVAEFDKPHRTRILEREVQKGEHEKVQGGYGKYQGTWVPYETGVDLAERYHVKELLQPIIEFEPTSESPPLAPKHITAASNKPRKPREPKEPKPIKPRPPKKTKKIEQIEDVMEIDSDHETNEVVSVESNTNVSVSPISSLTTTPAPLDSSNDITESDDAIPVQKTKRKRKQPEHVTASNNNLNSSNRPTKIAKNTPTPTTQYQQYGMLLWSYFTTNGTSIPDFVINPPLDFDPNIAIDQQGHTALHWAAAMANLEMTTLLSKAGSDLDRGNIHGETALMRSVMFPYNYDSRCFNEMVQILHPTIPNLDINDQTVLHHVAIFASSKGRIGPSRYYMEILLSNLALHPNEEYRKAIIDKQNHEGDTALNISARFANKKLVRLLMDAGADPQIRNAIGKNAEDYILELDHEAKSRAAAEQIHLQNVKTINFENQEVTSVANLSSTEVSETIPTASSTGVQISQNFVPNITSILQDFENSYQSQIQEKDQELSVTHSQLETVNNDLNKTKYAIEALRDKIRVLPARKERINELIGLVKERVEKLRQRRLDATISEEMKNAAPFQGGNAEKLAELKQKFNELKAGRRQLMGELIKVKTMMPDQNMTPYKRVIGLFSGDAGTTPTQMEMSI